MWKGSLIREIIDLPGFWLQVSRNEMPEYSNKKVSFGKNRFQYFLFLKPKTKVRKVIIYYHGGGWIFGNPTFFPGYVSCFLKEGYAVILPTYRRLPFVNFIKIREELTLGSKAIFELLEKENLSNLPVILGGMSAGAHCAAHLFYDLEELKKINSATHPFSALMLFGAPVDLQKMAPTPVLRLLAGRPGSRLFQYANPVNLLSNQINKPVLGVHGKKDGLARFENSASFFNKLKTYHPQNTEFLILEESTHLDSVKWTHSPGQLRTKILDWLTEIH